MLNQWLGVPLSDYEGHMSAPGVEQLVPLAELFALVLDLTRPESLAVLGVAGGNGLAAIDQEVTRRVVGIDIHQEYLDEVKRRYSGLPQIELYRIDLANEAVKCPPVDLVHAALVFEHAGTARCLDNAIAMVESGGNLSVVLQLPSQAQQNVSPTAFVSLQALGEHFRLIEPRWLIEELTGRSFAIEREIVRPLPSGKGFWLGLFVRLA
jgi:hypothetical protein